MRRSAYSHIEQMFAQTAIRDGLLCGGSTSETTERECEAQIAAHAGRALEIAMHVLYAVGADRVIGREYPGVAKKDIEKDFKGGHTLVPLYNRILNEVNKPALKDALEHEYQEALHAGITDIVDGHVVRGTYFRRDQVPFMERTVEWMSDGNEQTVDHGGNSAVPPWKRPRSDFLKMPFTTFPEFLRKVDNAYYERDLAGKEGEPRNIQWSRYAARDHESGRPYVTVGAHFFGRFVHALINLSRQPWVWHRDVLDRFLDRRCDADGQRVRDLITRLFGKGVELPPVKDREVRLRELLESSEEPYGGRDDYSILHRRLSLDRESGP